MFNNLLFVWIFSATTMSFDRMVGDCGMPGGKCSVDPNDPQVKDVAQATVCKLNEESGVCNVLVQIVNGSSQVVAGINYELYLLAGECDDLVTKGFFSRFGACPGCIKDHPARGCDNALNNEALYKARIWKRLPGQGEDETSIEEVGASASTTPFGCDD